MYFRDAVYTCVEFHNETMLRCELLQFTSLTYFIMKFYKHLEYIPMYMCVLFQKL